MTSIKIMPFYLLFFMMSFFQSVSANELNKDITVKDSENMQTEKIPPTEKLYQNYNVTFLNNTGAPLRIWRKGSQCMHGTGETKIYIDIDKQASTSLQDSNDYASISNNCGGYDKYVTWEVDNYLYPPNGRPLGICTIQLRTHRSWFKWYTDVFVKEDLGRCNLNVLATCDKQNCMNIDDIPSNTSDTPSDIVITFGFYKHK
ncbi:hypothetical protein [Xenorhabdus szentirmaii]|uniref:hypothetical protein n=1 Tax=Xenorhabdus szentirmaii TaxID=290112 RepID=UPI000C051D9A|nr:MULTISPECIES: hypothetical protein [Xenorhabdus]MBD2793756.1 hypothetical protein [Xenorhabdus sp. CUL]MBD2823840.1 hypothetical protein [Xenorhabdus sp. 5]PHM44178.1 hypothetical protein Xszus_04004 [Xenorhabdus szentirmaii]